MKTNTGMSAGKEEYLFTSVWDNIGATRKEVSVKVSPKAGNYSTAVPKTLYSTK